MMIPRKAATMITNTGSNGCPERRETYTASAAVSRQLLKNVRSCSSRGATSYSIRSPIKTESLASRPPKAQKGSRSVPGRNPANPALRCRGDRGNQAHQVLGQLGKSNDRVHRLSVLAGLQKDRNLADLFDQTVNAPDRGLQSRPGILQLLQPE